MSMFESLQVSAFGIGIVFAVLASLSLLIKLLSGLGAHIDKTIAAMQGRRGNIEIPDEEPEQQEDSTSSGELKLIGVDERTAAMIMAIVSNESGISLSELQFKYIKAVE